MVRDAVGEMVASLKNIERLLKRDIEGTEDEEEKNTDNGDEVAVYFSTGENGETISRSGDEYHRVRFGLLAKGVTIRSDQDLVVAFNNPERSRGYLILVKAAETPFEVGGDPSIDTEKMWVKKANAGDPDATVYIEAIR